MIVDERIVTFLNSMETENSEILEQIEKEALADRVPIIRKETQSWKWTALAAVLPTVGGGLFCMVFANAARLFL